MRYNHICHYNRRLRTMSGPEGSSIKNYRLCVMAFILEEITMNDEEYMKIAYQEALKALQEDEVPIGAIIVKDNQIITKSYNQRENKNQATAHAELSAIQNACDLLGSWRLDDCILYTTLEPCLMCSGAIIQSRIKKVVYGASSDKWISLNKLLSLPKSNFNHIPEIQGGILEEECTNLIKNYFKEKRSY